MSKIICDICGTTYPDTADQCPICGCARDAAADLLGDELLMEQVDEEPHGRGGRFTAAKKRLFVISAEPRIRTRRISVPFAAAPGMRRRICWAMSC